MAKIKSSMINMIVVLTTITAAVGAILGGVYKITEAPIAQANARAQEEAIRIVAPDFDNNPIAESDTIESNGQEFVIYPACKEGQTVGAAVKTSSRNGFNGEIVIIVGFEQDGTIRQYRVLSHAETPGLGAKMEQWFRTDKNKQSILGLHPAKVNLTVSKDGGDVDAITASTITSRAFLEAVSNAYKAYTDQPIDALSGSSRIQEDHASHTYNINIDAQPEHNHKADSATTQTHVEEEAAK